MFASLTDNDIIKALECCANHDNVDACDDCPCLKGECISTTPYVLDLINRYEAKIAELTEENNRQKSEIERLKKVQVQYVKAYFDEFAERLKNDFRLAQLDTGLTSAVVDELVDTMNSEFENLEDYTDLIERKAVKKFASIYCRDFICISKLSCEDDCSKIQCEYKYDCKMCQHCEECQAKHEEKVGDG